MLERLLRRGGGGLSREQEELLAEHRARGDRYVGELIRDVSRAEEAQWTNTLGAETERWTPVSPWKTDAGERLLGEPPDVAVSVVVAAAAGKRVDSSTFHDTWTLALALARRKLAYRAEDVQLLFALADDPPKRARQVTSSAGGVWFMDGDEMARFHREQVTRIALAAAERLPAESWTADLRRVLREAQARVERDKHAGREAERTKLLSRFRRLHGDESAGDEAAELPLDVVATDDELGKPLRKELAGRWAEDAGAAALLAHLAVATGGPAPTKKWQQRARELVDATGDGDELLRTVLRHSLAAKDGTRRSSWGLMRQWLSDENATLVRGASWAAGAIGAGWAPAPLADLAEHAATPFEPGHEPRSIKVANAAVRQLGEIGNDDSVAALAHLNRRIKHKTIAKQIQRALEQAATAAGLTKGELLERQVRSFDLDADGRREVLLGSATALVERDRLSWVSDGKAVKSVPKAVKEEHPAELRELRAEQKEIRKALADERLRVESLLAEKRRWDVEEWRRLYLDHPLTSSFARRLIWRFDGEAALPLDGTFVRADGLEVEPAGEVSLWHPLGAPTDEVAAWRRLLLDRQLTQPFKQAFREVYIVAPAELETRTYSNRFAAHIVKYRQAYALAKARGWSVVALGPYDNDGGRQWRDFEPCGIRAEFWMEHAAEDWDAQDLIANLASTDQVRFASLGGGDPIPLDEVPSLVFSEAMRDVDLFVSVGSIAADPEWADRGERYIDYWREHAFGELGAAAATRREVVAELIPQLKIADRLELEERCLRVRGDLRTYKIHLGSANVLMEPNDQYLCIVRDRAKGVQNVLLPFEDDARLSEILSKAVLLAADTKITDRTILDQIKE
jgi:Domain of unknown function (DUF4132)